MKYELINEINPFLSPTEQILVNRGIKLEDIPHYLNTTDGDINDYNTLGAEVLTKAAKTLALHINSGSKTLIIVDSDCDGFTSAAYLTNYLYSIFPAWVENDLEFFFHSGKQHGLNDCIDRILEKEYKLVIVPDAGSNDFKEMEILKSNGIDFFILDHHEIEGQPPEYSIIINNQFSKYPNKELSGVGVTYQFCRYLDTKLQVSNADNFIDLVALGNLADMMSLLSLETKHLILKGFEEDNINNPFIYHMSLKNSYSLGDKITPMGAAFYIAPFVNAICRSGTLEEKELIFKSMLTHEAFKEILSTKRGHKLGEMEKVVDQALRVATNVKNRQTKAQDAGLEFLEHMIEDNNMLSHKALVFLLEPGQVDAAVRGLVANKFMAKYQRPCCILTKVTENNSVSYQGSARGCDKSGITNFKDICAGFDQIDYVAGHQGAFGLGIPEDAASAFIKYLDEVLKDTDSTPKYLVDFIYDDITECKYNDVLAIAKLDDLWGKDMSEPYIVLKDLEISPKDVTVYTKKGNTLKISLKNRIDMIQFRASDDLCELLQKNEYGYVTLDVVVKCAKNEWMGRVSPQFIIEDYVIKNETQYCF